MHKVIDGDGHIYEWQQTFADEYLDPAFHHRRPVIVDGPQQLHWLVDNVAFPGLYGTERFGFEGSPVSRGDVRRDSIAPKPESLGILEMRDPDRAPGPPRGGGDRRRGDLPHAVPRPPVVARSEVRSGVLPVVQQLDGRRLRRARTRWSGSR